MEGADRLGRWAPALAELKDSVRARPRRCGIDDSIGADRQPSPDARRDG